jgi:AraC-like DNA-binding protein
MSMVIRPQAPALAPFVRSIAYYDAEPGPLSSPSPPARRERSLPSGGVSLMVNLNEDEFRTYHGPGHATVHRVGGAVLAGPRAEHTVIDTAEQRGIVEVSFTPGGAAPFFAGSLADTREQLVELGDLWGRDGVVLRERLLSAATPAAALRFAEAVLLDHLAGPPTPDPAVAFAVRAFERDVSVSEVTARLGLLPKRFVHRFRTHVGLTPKRFSRVRRLQRLLRHVHCNGVHGGGVHGGGLHDGTGAADWARVAADHGYFDQAHLINDFRAMTGMTPAAYLAAVGGAPNHVPLAH